MPPQAHPARDELPHKMCTSRKFQLHQWKTNTNATTLPAVLFRTPSFKQAFGHWVFLEVKRPPLHLAGNTHSIVLDLLQEGKYFSHRGHVRRQYLSSRCSDDLHQEGAAVRLMHVISQDKPTVNVGPILFRARFV